jgi:hypothetical protein
MLCAGLLAVSSLVAAEPALAADAKAATASDKAAIEARENTYNEGFNSRDVEKIMSCYAPGKKLFVFDVIPPREYPSWDAYKKKWHELFAAFPDPVSNTLSEQTIISIAASRDRLEVAALRLSLHETTKLTSDRFPASRARPDTTPGCPSACRIQWPSSGKTTSSEGTACRWSVEYSSSDCVKGTR